MTTDEAAQTPGADPSGDPRGRGRTKAGLRELRRGVYEIRTFVGKDPLTGKRLQRSETFHGGYRDAVRRRAQLVAESQQAKRATSGATVGDLLEAWLARCEERRAAGDLSANTIASYQYQQRRLRELAPAFLALRLDRIDTAQPVEELLSGLRRSGVTDAGLVQTHKALRAAFEWGIGHKWLRWNPAKYLDATPRPPEKKTPKATVEDVKRLIEIAPSVHPDLGAYFLLAALTGLRRQALCGLRWSDIDAEGQQLTVNRVRNVVWGKTVDQEFSKHRRSKEKPVKWLDPIAVDTLGALREAQRRRCVESVTTPPDDGWVFSADGLGLTPMNPDFVQRRVKRAADLAGLPHRSHDMRHHRATELIGAGVDVGRVADELDHRDKSFTLRTYVGSHPAGEGAMAGLGRRYVDLERANIEVVPAVAAVMPAQDLFVNDTGQSTPDRPRRAPAPCGSGSTTANPRRNPARR